MPDSRLIIGIDVGSTTDKVVVVDPASDALLWSDYQRHEGKQLSRLLEMLRAVEYAIPVYSSPGAGPARWSASWAPSSSRK